MDALDSLRIESALAAQTERESADDATGQTDFLQMLVAQLENQDPLNPQDSAQFAAQLAQFSTVEQLIGVRTGVEELVALQNASGPGTGTANVDPTSLIGREVTVEASQVRLDPSQGPVQVTVRNDREAYFADVVLRDAAGNERARQSLQGVDAFGQRVPLPRGERVVTLDPAALGLPTGSYALDFEGRAEDGELVRFISTMDGVVTGATLAGEPRVRVLGADQPLTSVVEVRAAGGS